MIAKYYVYRDWGSSEEGSGGWGWCVKIDAVNESGYSTIKIKSDGNHYRTKEDATKSCLGWLKSLNNLKPRECNQNMEIVE